MDQQPDIVIPYTLDLHRGLELLYALRSIEKHLTGFNDVTLIGDRPNWYKGKHLHCVDIRERKEASIMNKVLKAALDPDISSEFIMWHDDHMLLQPLAAKDIKYWYDKTLQDALINNSKGYGTTLQNTIDKLKYSAKNFDIHTPIIFNSDQFISLMIQGWPKEYCLKSLYCNTLQIEGEQMDDMKLNTPYSVSQVQAKIAGRLFFSTGPLALVGEMETVWQELYPTRSRWEK